MPPNAPAFCPFCGKPRSNDMRPCPSCAGPSLRTVLSEQGGRDAVSFFGDDVPTLLYDDVNNAYYVNPEKSKAKWAWQTGQVSNQFPFTITANQTRRFQVKMNPDVGLRGDIETCSFMLTSTGRLAVQPFVPLLDKYLSNGLVPSSLMFGTAQLQGLLAQTIYSIPSFDWWADAQDLSAADNTVSPVFFGRRLMDNGQDRIQEARRAAGMSRFVHPFWLVPTTAFNNTTNVGINPNPTISIPTLANVTVTYTVPSDADFECWYILDDSSTSNGANTEINDLFARIKEGPSGADLVLAPGGSNGLAWRSFIASPTVPVTGFPSGGTNSATGGIRAASLPSPAGGFTHLFKRGTDIQVTFVSTDTGTITLRSAFVGLLVYGGDPAKGECQ